MRLAFGLLVAIAISAPVHRCFDRCGAG